MTNQEKHNKIYEATGIEPRIWDDVKSGWSPCLYSKAFMDTVKDKVRLLSPTDIYIASRRQWRLARFAFSDTKLLPFLQRMFICKKK